MSRAALPTVLIADDDPGHLKVLELVLAAHSFEVATARDGHEALTWLQSHTPAAMILDIHMPFMSGLDVCGRVRRVSRLREVPVVILTAAEDEKSAIAVRTVKADLLIRKPITGKDVSGTVSRLIAARGPSRPPG